MIYIPVYVRKSNFEIVDEKEKENIISNRACELIEDTELFNEFLSKRFTYAELLYIDFKNAFEIQREFFDECRETAEGEFGEYFIKKYFTLEE